MDVKLDISPNFGQAVGVFMTTLGGLGEASAQLTTLFGDGPAKMIVAGASLACIIFGPAVAVLFRGSSSQPGPWATQDPGIVKAAAIVASVPEDAHPDQMRRAVGDLNAEIVKEASPVMGPTVVPLVKPA